MKKPETFVLQVVKIDGDLFKWIEEECGSASKVNSFICDCINARRTLYDQICLDEDN